MVNINKIISKTIKVKIPKKLLTPLKRAKIFLPLIIVSLATAVFISSGSFVKSITYPSGCFTAVYWWNSNDGLNRLLPFSNCATEGDLLRKVSSPTPISYEAGCRFSDKTCWTKKDTLDGNYDPNDGWDAHQDHCSYGIYKYVCDGKRTSCPRDSGPVASYPSTITDPARISDCPAGYPGEVTATINQATEVCGKTIEVDLFTREYYIDCVAPYNLRPDPKRSAEYCAGTTSDGAPNNIHAFADSLVWYTGDCPGPIPTPEITKLQVKNAGTPPTFSGSYGFSGKQVSESGSNWLNNPLEISVTANPGTGSMSDYYVAFYDKREGTSSIQAPYSSIIDSSGQPTTSLRNQLLNSYRDGFILRYSNSRSYIWDPFANNWIDITDIRADVGYRICGKDSNNSKDCLTRHLYTVYPSASPATWNIQLRELIYNKEMYTAVYAVNSSNGSRFEANYTPSL